MKRAYVFVLREKQREVMEQAAPIHERFLAQQPEEAEDYLPETIEEMRQKLEKRFNVTLTDADLAEGVGFIETISGVIAEKLLERDPPPNMIPKRTGSED